MPASRDLHSTVLYELCQANPTEDLRRQKVCAWAVTGLILEKTINLPALALVIDGTAKTASRVRRLRRFLANQRVNVRAYYDALIRRALRSWEGHTVVLALDTTITRNRMGVCRLSVVYRGRGVPLVWHVYAGRSSTLQFDDYRSLLDHARTLLPRSSTVVLLVDRGFNTSLLMAWCHRNGWHYRIRLRKKFLVTLGDGECLQLAEIHLRRGMVRFFQAVRISKFELGPANLALAWSGMVHRHVN